MLRLANQADGTAIVQLLMVIFLDMELPFVQRYGPATTAAILLKAMEDPTYRYAYGRGLVKEVDGVVAGVAFGYPAEDEPLIDLPFKEQLTAWQISPEENLFQEPETFPDEWYLDSIAVAPEFRGQGIGSQLLKALPETAEKAGKALLGLNVDQGNPKAKKLYQQVGFATVGQLTISQHLYDHMQKRI